MRFNNVNSVALEQKKLELEKDKIYLSSNETFLLRNSGPR